MTSSATLGAPNVVVSILNWNGWQDTLACMESLRRLDYPNYLVVVVDNGSWNDSAERIKAGVQGKFGPNSVLAEYSEETAHQGGDERTEGLLRATPPAQRMVLIRNKENKGFSGGHNVAIRYALSRREAADMVFVLNNDALVPPDCLTRLISVQQSAQAGIVGAVVTEKENPQVRLQGPFSFRAGFFAPLIRSSAGLGNDARDYQHSDFVIGAAMLIKRDVLTAIGTSTGEYFPSDLFFSGEEQVFCFKAKRMGYPIVMARDVVVEHLGGRSAGGKGSTLMYYYGQRNSVLLARVILPFRLRMPYYLLNLSFAMLRIGKNMLRRRSRAAWAVFQGVLDGYLGRRGKWKYHDREAAASR